MAITVIYGSDGGTTEAIAKRIAKKLSGKTVDVAAASTGDFEDCDLLILGAPTYGEGDLQCDWEDNLEKLKTSRIADKRVALFGTGDQETYPDSFVDAMGILYDYVVEQGAVVVGFTETNEYSFTKSAAERDGKFVGLALDEDNQSSQTGKRIASWISQLA